MRNELYIVLEEELRDAGRTEGCIVEGHCEGLGIRGVRVGNIETIARALLSW